MINKLICKCKKATFSFHTIKDIPLLIDDKEEEVPLISLIENYFKNEIVDYEEKCIFCNKIYPHEKITSIINLPEILILSLQRFNPVTREKKNTKVMFDTILNINPFVDETIKDQSNCTYNLFGVINHEGTLDFGHYYSYVKIKSKDVWYKFNDSLVESKGKNIKFDFTKVYILFYYKNK